MKIWIAASISLLLCACAASRTLSDAQPLFLDDAFASPPAQIANLDVFALNAGMRRYLSGDIAKQIARSGRNYGLYEILRRDLRLEYDAAVTRTAAEAFDARAGNCLSLVMLTAALAKHLQIPVHYRLVHTEYVWTRTGGLAFANGHVNIGLDPVRSVGWSAPDSALVIDFTPALRGTTGDFEEIPESQVVAMYMNNRAAESLVAGDVDAAYWWARAAIHKMPSFAPAYNTLGVVYRQHGNLAAAEKVFRYQLAEDRDDPTLLSNLALSLRQQGRNDEASAIEQRLTQIDRYRPFEFLDKGNAAIAAGDAKTAMKFYKQEMAHIPYSSELHFAIAVASARLGDQRGARKHLSEAMELSNNIHDRDLYAGKLQKLRELQVH